MFKVIFGGFFGAVIAFAWQFVSWTVLPWHDVAVNQFKNEEFVSWVMKENAPVSGVYVAPHFKQEGIAVTPGEIQKEVGAQVDAMSKGPFIYTQVKLTGINPKSAPPYIYGFITLFIGAALISMLLLRMPDLGYGGRLFAVILMGLLVGVLGFVPDWNWFGAGYKFTFIMIADVLATWFLAGLFLAGFVKERTDHGSELLQ